MRVWEWRDLPMVWGPPDEGGSLTIGYVEGTEFVRCAVFSPHLHGTILDFITDACNAAERHRPRRYAVSRGGKMVREVTVLEGEAVPLAQGESLGPHPSEIGEQSVGGKTGECSTCGPRPHEHVVGLTGRPCAEDYCAGYWDNIAWSEKHKAHVDKE